MTRVSYSKLKLVKTVKYSRMFK